MGALAGTVGSVLREYSTVVNIVLGGIVIVFGLNYMGILKLNIFSGGKVSAKTKDLGFVSAFIFGTVFSIGWTPCVGVFLGSALAMASQQAHMLAGVSMLLCYCAGLGIPFILSAVLIDRLRSTFAFIKKHYRIINLVCGSFLCLVGILMATGTLGWLLALLGGSL
jgi:cytochrome c-type biogenesis protein